MDFRSAYDFRRIDKHCELCKNIEGNTLNGHPAIIFCIDRPFESH